MNRTPNDQVISFLTDAHAIEEQAAAQMERAPGIAGDRRLAAIFEQHQTETTGHERRVRERLDQLGAEPSTLKDLAGRAGALPMVWFAKLNTDTPGKLCAHAYSYEHMELAAYELLALVADEVGDAQTAELARDIAPEERAMAARIADLFDVAVDASIKAAFRGKVDALLDSYLKDAHAIEAQAIQLLEAAPLLLSDGPLAETMALHLEESRAQARLVEACLSGRDSRRSIVKDVGMRVGAINLGTFFKAQPDTELKLAGFAFAFEHLEIAAYELLARTAQRAGDADVQEAAEAILRQERMMAQSIRECFPAVVARTLDQKIGSAR